MIVLHEPKIIALKARKVASTSFEIALSKYASHSSIITPITKEDEGTRKNLGFRGAQNFQYTLNETFRLGTRELTKAILRGKLPRKYFNHIDAYSAKKYLGDRIWNGYTKVAIIRNPFDYAVSSYFWDQGKNASIDDFESWLLSNTHLLLMNNQQYRINGDWIIDFVIRYEHLENDIKMFEEKIPQIKGLWKTFSSINAKGQYRPRSAKIETVFEKAPRALLLIKEVYAEEIAEYGYHVPEAQ